MPIYSFRQRHARQFREKVHHGTLLIGPTCPLPNEVTTVTPIRRSQMSTPKRPIQQLTNTTAPSPRGQPVHLPNELITLIIQYALSDCPNYLTDLPLREYDEGAADEIYYDMKDNPWKYLCRDLKCQMHPTRDEKFLMASNIMHQHYDDLEYHHPSLAYVSRARTLALVSTTWLAIICDLFDQKFKQTQILQHNFRNAVLPESSFYNRHYPDVPCSADYLAYLKWEFKKTLKDCEAIKVAFRTESQILLECHYEIFSALRLVEQRAAEAERVERAAFEVAYARLEAENDGLRAVDAENGRLRAENDGLRAENDGLKATNTRLLRACLMLLRLVTWPLSRSRPR